MNLFYPKNNFKNISKNNNNNSEDTPNQTDYNEIYYTNELDNKQLCANVNQAQIPCDIVRACKTEPAPTPVPTSGWDSLSNSERAVLYKVAYEESAREILMRKLKEIEESEEESDPWGNY